MSKLFPGIPMGTPPTAALKVVRYQQYLTVKCKGVKKVAISDQYLAIARKRLKIDGYICIVFDQH